MRSLDRWGEAVRAAVRKQFGASMGEVTDDALNLAVQSSMDVLGIAAPGGGYLDRLGADDLMAEAEFFVHKLISAEVAGRALHMGFARTATPPDPGRLLGLGRRLTQQETEGEPKAMPNYSSYISESKGIFAPADAHTFTDSHLVNVVRKLKRDEGRVPSSQEWLVHELSRRGLKEVADASPDSLQRNAIDMYGMGDSAYVRQVLLDQRNKVIHQQLEGLRSVPLKTLIEMQEEFGHGEYETVQAFFEDLLSTRFPILESEKPLHRSTYNTPPAWVDASGRMTKAKTFGDVYLTQVVELLSERNEGGDIPDGDLWVFEEFVRRGLHNKHCPVKLRHMPLISALEESMSKVDDGVVEVPLTDLVKMRASPKDSLFNKLRQRERDAFLEAAQGNGGIPADPEYIEELLRAIDETNNADLSASLKEDPMNEPTEKTATTLPDSPEELEQLLQALNKQKAEVEERINAKKGLLGHPTARMVGGGVATGSKMLLATEAIDAVEALARKIALKFFIPEGHEGILDTPQGQMFMDLSMPIALHLAATHGLFGPGSEFIATTSDYAFVGNWFKHGKGMTSKVKEVMKEFSSEVQDLVNIGKGLADLGSGEGGFLSQVTDYGEKAEEVSKVKEKVEARS